MQDSTTKTINLPTNIQDPLPIVWAGDVPVRALVRTVDTSPAVNIGYELEDIGNTTNFYQLPAAQSDVFVLAPGQKLYARSSTGAAGQVSVAKSEAFPVLKG